MGKIAAFFISDSIGSVDKKGQKMTTICSPRVMLRPREIPGTLSFGLSFGIIGIPIKKENRFYVVIKNPQKESIHVTNEQKIPPFSGETTLPEEYQSVTVCMDMRNVSFDIEGVYSFEFIVNDELFGQHEIPVFLRAEK